MSLISANDSAALVFALNQTTASQAFAITATSPRVLLVDDEPMLLNSLCELLKGRGYHLVTASTGSEAILHLEKMKFDLALLDLRLPDYSGHEIMDFINANGIDMKVIVVSGDTGIDAAIGALKRGAYDYLRKPYTREELLTTVDNALRQKRLENENHSIAWQLECSEKLYRYLVDSSPDIIYTLNDEGRFTFVNDRAQHLLGYSPSELIGRHYSELVHEEDLERARYVFNERRVGQRASRNVELRLKSQLGNDQELTFENTLMTISFNSMGMYAVGNEPTQREFFGTYGVARDITDRKRAEAMISYQAYHDILTDLPNRVLFKDRLGLAVIQANAIEGVAASHKIAELRPWLEKANLDPAVRWKFTGADEEGQEAARFFAVAMAASLFLMGVILLWQFNSYYGVLVTLSAVALSTVGVLLGVVVNIHHTFDYISVIMLGTGVVALAGVVVGHNIVLVDT